MEDNEHKHITYHEIVKYVTAGADSFTFEELGFFENFEERLNICGVCNERIQAYFILSKLTDDKPEKESMFTHLFNMLRSLASDYVFENFTLAPMPALVSASTRNVIAGATAITNSPKYIELQKSEGYCFFELQEPTKLIVRMSATEARGKECTLIVCCECGNEDEQRYPLKKTESGDLVAITCELVRGRYISTVKELI